MWTPEEKEQRVNELLEFLNNELEAHNYQEFAYTKEILDTTNVLPDVILVLK